MSRTLVFALMLGSALLPALVTEAAAQRRARGGGSPLEFGPRVGRDFTRDAWSVGAQGRLLLGRQLELRPSGDVFFPDGPVGWQANGDAALRLGQGGGLLLGGGIALLDLTQEGSETGYNLFVGLSTSPPTDRSKSFLEARWTFVDDRSLFRLAAGLTYRL